MPAYVIAGLAGLAGLLLVMAMTGGAAPSPILTALKPLAGPLLDAVNAPGFVLGASLLIIVTAIAACASHWSGRVRPAIIRYGAVTQQLARQVPSQGVENRPWPETEGRIGELLRGAQVFPVAWPLLTTDVAEMGRIPGKPFAAYVAEDPIVASRENGSGFAALPGHFITFGLILTFVGLVAALYFAAKGFRSGSQEEARAAIIQLLNTASFKFLTSVAALTAAFGLSLFGRWSQGRIARARNQAVLAIDTLLRQARPAALRPDPSVELLREIAARLERLEAGTRPASPAP